MCEKIIFKYMIILGCVLTILTGIVTSQEKSSLLSETEFSDLIKSLVKSVKTSYDDLLKATRISTNATLDGLLNKVQNKYTEDFNYINKIIKNVEDKMDVNDIKNYEIVNCISTKKVLINSLKAQLDNSYALCKKKAEDLVNYLPDELDNFNKKMSNILIDNTKKIYRCVNKNNNEIENLVCFLDEKINILMVQKRILNDINLLKAKITTDVINETIDDIYCINKKTIFMVNQTEKIDQEVKNCLDVNL